MNSLLPFFFTIFYSVMIMCLQIENFNSILVLRGGKKERKSKIKKSGEILRFMSVCRYTNQKTEILCKKLHDKQILELECICRQDI